jgi:hypothetical protein
MSIETCLVCISYSRRYCSILHCSARSACICVLHINKLISCSNDLLVDDVLRQVFLSYCDCVGWGGVAGHGVEQITDMRKVRGDLPSERGFQGMASAGGNVYIFGGIATRGDGGLYLYVPTFCTFFSVGIGAMINSNAPPQHRAAFGFVGEGDSLYVFGGISLDAGC